MDTNEIMNEETVNNAAEKAVDVVEAIKMMPSDQANKACIIAGGIGIVAGLALSNVPKAVRFIKSKIDAVKANKINNDGTINGEAEEVQEPVDEEVDN